MDILIKLQDIFRDIFDDETIVLTSETTQRDIEDWDSLAQINIISACESDFLVKFHLNEVISIKKVGDIIDAIERKRH